MKFAIAKEHRDFFQKNGWIEFEDFLSKDQLTLLNHLIDQTLSNQLKIPVERVQTTAPESLFLHGHDNWRGNQQLRNLITQPRFGEIASELIEKKPVRLGFDQFFPALSVSKYKPESERLYSPFLSTIASLESISSIEGLVCALVICLGFQGSNAAHDETLPTIEGDIFPHHPGGVVYLSPSLDVTWKNLYIHPKQRYYLIAYTQTSAYYTLQVKDPHTHSLKHLGYGFNDRLNDKLNPIVFR